MSNISAEVWLINVKKKLRHRKRISSKFLCNQVRFKGVRIDTPEGIRIITLEFTWNTKKVVQHVLKRDTISSESQPWLVNPNKERYNIT